MGFNFYVLPQAVLCGMTKGHVLHCYKHSLLTVQLAVRGVVGQV